MWDLAMNDGWMRSSTDAVGMLADDGEQLDHVPKAFGEMDVGRPDLFDAGNMDGRRIDRETIGQGGEQNRLVGGVPAVHVERGVGLGVAERLGLGERGLEGEAGVGHAAEDVVRGAVDDAEKRQDAVADERILHRADDRDAARDGGLEMDRRVGLPRQREQFDARARRAAPCCR